MAVPVITIDFGNTISEVVTLTKSIEELRLERVKLQKQIEFGVGVEEENRKALVETEAAIRAQGKELRTLNSVIDNSIKQRKNEVGSIAANRAELSRLTAEYIKLGKPTKEQTERIKELSDTLKKQESAIGNTTRNVGNYQEAIENAAKGINIFGVNVGQTVEKLKTTQTLLKSSVGNVSGLAGAFNVLKVAIAATGIGLLVLALGALVTFLQKTETGMEIVAKATTIFSAAVDVVIKRVEQFGKGIIFFLNGDFKKGVDAVSGSFNGLGKEITGAVKAANELADAQERQEDLEIDFIKRRAEIRAAIQDQRDIANDETKSIQERQGALLKALDLQAEQASREKEIADIRLSNAQQEFELSAKKDSDRKKLEEASAQNFEDERDRTKEKIKLENELTTLTNKAASDKKKIDDEARKAAEDLQKANLELIEKFRETQETELQQIDEKEKKLKAAIETEIKDETEKAKLLKQLSEDTAKDRAKIQDKLVDEGLKILERANKNEIALIQDSYNKQIIAAGGNAEKIKEIENERNKALLQQTQDFLREQFSTIQSELQALTASTGEGGLADVLLSEEKKQELQDRLLEIEASISGVGVQLATIETNEETGKPRNLQTLLGLDEEGFETFQAGVAAATGILDVASQAVTAQTNNRLAQIEEEKNAAIKAAESRGEDTAAIEKKFAAQEDKIRKEQAKKAQIVAGIQAGIQTALAIMQALSGSPPPASYVLAAVAAALGAVQIATIASKKFEKGGELKRLDDGGKVVDIGGKPHSKGGTKISLDGVPVAEAEVGEKMFILKKTASEQIGRLSRFNQLFGGNSWTKKTNYAAQGGNIDGGFAVREFSRSVNERVANTDLIEGIISQLPTPEVKVSEINRVQRGSTQSVRVSELG